MQPTDDAAIGASLEERLAFERLLADLSATYANVPNERVVDEIEHGLARLNEFLGFDRSTFWEFAANGDRVALCSAAGAGLQPVPRGPASLQLDWVSDEIRAGRMVVLRSLPDDLPASAVAVREYVARLGIRSYLGIPLRVGGQIMGAIGFGAVRATRAWPEDLIARLKVVGEVFAQALARSRADSRLTAAHEEIKRLNARLEAENVYLRKAAYGGARERLASRSPSFKRIIEEIERIAPTDATVLLLGETGTGKELVAARSTTRSRAQQAGVRRGRLRGAPGDAHRERAVRPREGRVHRRARAADRAASSSPTAARSSSTRSASCRSSCSRSSCACSRTARVRARRRHADDPGRRARGRGDQPRSRGRGDARRRSARTSTTGSPCSRSSCRRCASAARTSRCSPGRSSRSSAKRWAARSSASPTTRWRRCRLRLAGQRARAAQRHRARR